MMDVSATLVEKFPREFYLDTKQNERIIHYIVIRGNLLKTA